MHGSVPFWGGSEFDISKRAKHFQGGGRGGKCLLRETLVWPKLGHPLREADQLLSNCQPSFFHAVLRRLEEHLIGMLKFGKKEGAQSKPVEKQQAVQKEPKVAEKKSAATTQLAAQKTSEKVEGGGDEEAEDEEAEDEGDANPLAAAIRAKKKGLKQTEVSQRFINCLTTQAFIMRFIHVKWFNHTIASLAQLLPPRSPT